MLSVVPQLVPYMGDEIPLVKVEACNPAVNLERREVLEVSVYILGISLLSGSHQFTITMFLPNPEDCTVNIISES